MVWKAWTSYTVTCREKKAKWEMSKSLFSSLLLRRVWRGWRLYSERRKEKQEEKEFCSGWHVEWLKRRHWVQWRRALSLRMEGQGMELTALHHWATALQTRVTRQSAHQHTVISDVCVCVCVCV